MLKTRIIDLFVAEEDTIGRSQGISGELIRNDIMSINRYASLLKFCPIQMKKMAFDLIKRAFRALFIQKNLPSRERGLNKIVLRSYKWLT